MSISVAIRLHPEGSSDSGARAIAVECRIAVKCIFEECSVVVNKESRTERNKREVRGRILAAAPELFDENGVEAICDRADVAFGSHLEAASRFPCDAIAPE